MSYLRRQFRTQLFGVVNSLCFLPLTSQIHNNHPHTGAFDSSNPQKSRAARDGNPHGNYNINDGTAQHQTANGQLSFESESNF
jgi:hypothetical protein